MKNTKEHHEAQAQEQIESGLSVIIPVYNSSEIMPELIKRLETVLRDGEYTYEILLINDCSSDKSWETICTIAEANASVRGINLMKNFGQHNALLCGTRMARHDTIITMDDDLQHPPEAIPKLLNRLKEGHDVVYGFPTAQQHGVLRGMASQITKLVLQKGMGADAARHISAFRAFNTNLRSAFQHHNGSFVSLDVMLTWATNDFSTLPVEHAPRHSGKSNYTVRQLIIHAFNMITGFSVIPLQIASILGFLLTLFGVFVLIYVVGRYILQGTTAPGFPFLAAIISIFSGAQLCALGVIGEYLARMHIRIMNAPCYSIRSTINCVESAK